MGTGQASLTGLARQHGNVALHMIFHVLVPCAAANLEHKTLSNDQRHILKDTCFKGAKSSIRQASQGLIHAAITYVARVQPRPTRRKAYFQSSGIETASDMATWMLAILYHHKDNDGVLHGSQASPAFRETVGQLGLTCLAYSSFPFVDPDKSSKHRSLPTTYQLAGQYGQQA